MKPRRIAIAGAGLAGLYAAAALARRGVEVVVVERAAALGEAGAGIQISPNGARLLARIGALTAVEAAAFQPEAAEIRLGVSGATVLHLPLGAVAEARWGAPYLQVHRADLLAAVEAAARNAGAAIRLGAAVTGVGQTPTGAALLLEGGEAVEADVVIGADGVRSTVRTALFGPVEPRFTGQVAWRGTVPRAALRPGTVHPTATVWVGPGRHLVTYYLRRGDLVNFVAVEERSEWRAEDWSQKGDPADVRAAFAGWRPGATDVLAAAETCLLWGLFDRPAPPAWSSGRVALMGDACHPMLPFMAQGAVQAFEDGAALARLLPQADDPAAAFRAYEIARRPRATRVQAAAQANARLFHATGLVDRFFRYAPIALGARLAPRFALSRLDWLYGHVEAA
ncbi:MAG: salicylate 1-monooxygenase [Rhodobacteraceae bacterium]|nr:MAG: salicylate 1-monooxygenase [Paracoccaceae bacterium]